MDDKKYSKYDVLVGCSFIFILLPGLILSTIAIISKSSTLWWISLPILLIGGFLYFYLCHLGDRFDRDRNK